MPTETEVKLPVADVAAARARLLALGARPVRERVFEDNVLLDDPEARLASRGSVLRVRSAGGSGVLTFKGARQPSAAGLKTRTEIEVGVDDPSTLQQILAQLGLVPRFRYQKYRETFELGGCEVVLDETPIGAFLEVEGEPGPVQETARALGYGPESYVAESYVSLFFARGGTGDMVFAPGDRR